MPKATTPFAATKKILSIIKGAGIAVRRTDPARGLGSYSPAFRQIDVARNPGGKPVSIFIHESGHAMNQKRESPIQDQRFTSRALGNAANRDQSAALAKHQTATTSGRHGAAVGHYAEAVGHNRAAIKHSAAASVASLRMENGANQIALKLLRGVGTSKKTQADYRKTVTPYFKSYQTNAKDAVRAANAGKIPAKLVPVLKRDFEGEFLARLQRLDAKLDAMVNLSRK